MAKITSVNVRLDASERERLERLAGGAGLSFSKAVRALIRSAEQITPERPSTAVFERDNGAGVIRQDSPRAVAS